MVSGLIRFNDSEQISNQIRDTHPWYVVQAVSSFTGIEIKILCIQEKRKYEHICSHIPIWPDISYRPEK